MDAFLYFESVHAKGFVNSKCSSICGKHQPSYLFGFRDVTGQYCMHVSKLLIPGIVPVYVPYRSTICTGLNEVNISKNKK